MGSFLFDLRASQFANLAVKALELSDLHTLLRTAHKQLQGGTGALVKLVPGRLRHLWIEHHAVQLWNDRIVGKAFAGDAPNLRQGRQHTGVISIQGRKQVPHFCGFPSPTSTA